MSSPRRLLSTAVFGFALLAFASAARAQYPGYVTNNNDTGLPDYGSFISSSIDSVNLANGGVIIRIPFASRKDRSMGYVTGFQYDSKYWVVNRTYYPYPQRSQNTTVWTWYADQSNAGWRGYTDTGGRGASYDSTEQLYTCTPSNGSLPPMQVAFRSNYVITDETGAKHQVPIRKLFTFSQYPGTYCPDDFSMAPQNLKAESDSGQWQLDITNETYLNRYGGAIRSISGVQPFSGAVDTNGNGCCVLPVPYSAGGIVPAGAGSTATFPFTYVDSNGATQTIQTTWMRIAGQTSFPTTSCSQFGGCEYDQGGLNLTVIQKIQLPNGLSYTFSYIDPATGLTNPYGEIMQITLPTGGYVKYKWATLAQRDLGPTDVPLPTGTGMPVVLDARVVSERRVTEDGVNEKVWTYAYAGPAGFVQTTTVTDPLGNVEVHTFGGPLEASVVYYQGSSTPVKRLDTAWGMDTGPVTIDQPVQDEYGNYPAVLNPVNRNFRVAGTITTLMDTNQVTQTQTDYGDCYTYNIFPSGTYVQGGNSFTECHAVPTETREYDFGTGAAGALLRKTDLTYLHQSNSTYLNAHMLTLATLKTVKDGAGNTVAQTSMTYDSTTISSSGGTAINHDYTNYGTSNTLRGNPTVVSRWLNTTSTWLTTTNYYNDLGNLIQTTDPGGHTYTLSYADNWTDGVNRNAQAFLTSVTSPTTNGVAHIEGKQYFYNTGLTAAVCGQNYPTPANCSNTASLPASDYARYTYDIMGRPLTVTHGDGGATSFTFTEPASPSPSSRIRVSSTSAIDASQNLANAAVIDGLGRVIQTQLNSDPDGADFVDTTFDDAGRKHTVSNPHRNTGGSTDGVTTYVYDGLGRVTTLIPPDGTSTSNNVSTAYSGNTVMVTDQAGKQRRSVTDGLGRLIEVDEPGAPPSGSGVTASNGYAMVTGAVQTGGGAGGHGTVTISGSEQTTGYWQDPTCLMYDDSGNCTQWTNMGQPTWVTIWDYGFVQATINGRTKGVGYGQGSTPATIAAAVASAINGDSLMAVTAVANGAVLTLTAKTHGTATDYLLSVTSWTNDSTDFTGGPSFTATPSGAVLTGGANDYPDTGTVWVNVGGAQVSVSYGGSSTASTIATALASAINGNSSLPVTASASSGAVNLTEKTQGSAPSLSAGSTTNYPSTFAQPSFAVAPFDSVLDQTANNVPLSLATAAVTLYTYDTLDNLTCVEQHGNVSGTGCASASSNDAASPWRVRRFTYDSLSRLLTAKNPESGTITYTYDSDGNLLTKTDARSITTTYSYDQLHRLTQKSYSDSTPTVKNAYDGPIVTGCTSPTLTSANSIGRRSSMCDAAGWEAWSYDARGHVITDRRNTNSVTKDTTYVYNFAGGETSVTYPSGRTITYTYNPAAQVTSASDVAGSITYASNAHYAPPGELAFLQEGSSGISSTYIFNNRLQPCWMYSTTGTPAISWSTTQCTNTATTANILDYKYNFSLGTANNGNVTSITNNINTARSQSFTYDELNRILTAKTQATTGQYSWGLNFGYDAWANLLHASVSQGSAYLLNASMDPTYPTNRLLGYSHDASGNMLNDGVNNYTFDAESQLKTAAGVTYTYDGDGNRVQKSNGKLYWHGGGSDPLVETDAAGNTNNSSFNEYIFFGGKRIARRDSSNNVLYYFADHLGTARVTTNASGTIQDDSDFYPFGGERPYLSLSGNSYKFTGKLRDQESGLDDFDARYYSSALGRFVSADWSAVPTPVPYADFGDPQSLNLYTYVRNIPTTKVDVTGHDDSDGSFVTGFLKELYNQVASMINFNKNYGGKDPNNLIPDVKTKQANNIEEKVGMITASIAVLLTPFGEEAEASKMTEFTEVMQESRAFAEAVQGGKNAGFLENYAGRSEEELSRGISSLDKEIATHEDKIANPSKYDKNWGTKTDKQQQGLLNKWSKEKKNFKAQKEILQGIKKIRSKKKVTP